MTYRLLDLFSGIGGFSLGLERSGGFKTVAFCEVEPFCTKILNKHWPEVPVYGDVRELTAERLAADGIGVDAICGGFPCQDISTAGKGAGIEGERSGLWSEYARLIGELRPRYVFVENVAALLGRGMDRVLGDLAAIGYDAEWHCIPASAVGAPHRRDRIWIMAHPTGERRAETGKYQPARSEERPTWRSEVMANAGRAYGNGRQNLKEPALGEAAKRGKAADYVEQCREVVAYANGAQREGSCISSGILEEYANTRSASWWSFEPDVGRVADGVSDWSHRLKALGNAVVPQIPELLGRAVLRAEGRAA
jgi:DNA (cytosine-5)-methyltransferase 1